MQIIKEKRNYFDQNFALFVNLLRREGLPVSTTEIFDALQALEWTDIASKSHFKSALQATLVKNRRDQQTFDLLFDHFFSSSENHGNKVRELSGYKKQFEDKLKQANLDLQFKGEPLRLESRELEQYSALTAGQRERLQSFVRKTENGVNVEPQFKPILETIVKSHLRYCRQQEHFTSSGAYSAVGSDAGSGTGKKDLDLCELDIRTIKEADFPAAEQQLQELSRKLAFKILRRKSYGFRYGKIDLRRSLRDNMCYGGIIFRLKHRPKRRTKQQILLLCDVSASMKRYSTFVIHFLHGLRQIVRELSCFSFSDTLENLTPELKGRVGLNHLLDRIVRQSKNWGGGTNLGFALEDLEKRFPDHLNVKTTIVVVSDAKTIKIDQAVREFEMIKDKVKRIIWLNPLPVSHWADFRSIREISGLVEMWPCSTISQLEEVLSGRL
ncbi:MAG: VWA domain-containing protein [Bacillota bacterium]|nr:VWA domain-containing protein [Bacillota bacterium]